MHQTRAAGDELRPTIGRAARLEIELPRTDAAGHLARCLRRTDVKHVGGWGLDIFEDLANRWGMREGATHVWFELERRARRLGKPDR